MNDVAQIRTLVRQSQSIAFTGERRDFFRLVRRGALLELITAGFYRFWLATDIRRSLWSGTLVDGIPLVLFFYAFGQFAIFRARRYRATRTVWRGARFWMSGYSWRACLWSLLVLLTLGLALPWRESALERYKMRHLHYGDLPARFEPAHCGSKAYRPCRWRGSRFSIPRRKGKSPSMPAF